MKLSDGTYVVTGAAGFTGGHLLNHLHDLGVSVRAVVHRESSAHALRSLGYEVVVADLRDAHAMRRAVNGARGVFHVAALFRQAGLPESEFHAVNATATRTLLDACIDAKVERVIHCSTVGVLGDIAHPPGNEDTPYSPGDMYQRSKMEGELIALDYFGSGKIPGVVIRPAMIFGPGDTRTLKMFRMIERRTFFYVGSGETSVHFIDVRDLARAFSAAMARDSLTGKTYIIAGERHLPLREVAGIIAEELGVPAPWIHLPVRPMQLLGTVCETICTPFRINPPIFRRRVDFFTKNRHFDSSRAARDLEFKPSQTVREEIRDIIKWYRLHGYLHSNTPPTRPLADPDPIQLTNSLTHTAMVREIDGGILFWNLGAEHRYGWKRDEALGTVSHDLLRTRFPKPLDEINEDLIRSGEWRGDLTHTTRNGATVQVSSHWKLHSQPGAASPVVLEQNC